MRPIQFRTLGYFFNLTASPTTSSSTSTPAEKNALSAAFNALTAARKTVNEHFNEYDQDVITSLTKQLDSVQDASFTTLATMADAQIEANRTTIKQYVAARTNLLGGRAGNPMDIVASQLGIAPPLPDPANKTAAPTTPDGRPVIDSNDFWTSIAIEVAESYDAAQSRSSERSYSTGGRSLWGLFSLGGSVNHSESSSDTAKQMAHSSVSVKFECMRVDITRPWLRSELFFDSDLAVTPGSLCVSPILLWILLPFDNRFQFIPRSDEVGLSDGSRHLHWSRNRAFLRCYSSRVG